MKTERLADVLSLISAVGGAVGLAMQERFWDKWSNPNLAWMASFLLGAITTAGIMFLLYRLWTAWLPRSFKWGAVIFALTFSGIGSTGVLLVWALNAPNTNLAIGWTLVAFVIQAVTGFTARAIYLATSAIDRLTLYRIILLSTLVLAFLGAFYKIGQAETFQEHLPWIAAFAGVAVSVLVVHQKLFRKFHPNIR